MNAADDTELRRLCEHLKHIDERTELSAPERESLQKARLEPVINFGGCKLVGEPQSLPDRCYR